MWGHIANRNMVGNSDYEQWTITQAECVAGYVFVNDLSEDLGGFVAHY